MTIFQITAALFGLYMIFVVSIYQKKKILGDIESSLWLTTWALFIVFALFPNLLLGVVDIIKFARVFDLLVVVSLMVLTTMIFLSYFQQKELKIKLEKYVRQEAIYKATKLKK